MKIACFFSGQGAQYTGMGEELYHHFPKFKEIIHQANHWLPETYESLVFQPTDKLNDTAYTQPLIYTMSVAAYALLQEAGIKADIVAGLSLGEYAALTASGTLPFEQGLPLVMARGKIMSQGIPQGVGKMVAVLNTPKEVIQEVCDLASSEGVVVPANFNTEKQVVIGGDTSGVTQAVQLLKDRGYKKVLPLKVSGPFHTPLLEPASHLFAKSLDQVTFQPLQLPIVSNVTGDITTDEKQLPHLLTQQMYQAVQWEKTMETCFKTGVTHVIEVGPGKVLSQFVRQTNREIKVLQVENLASFEKTIEELQASQLKETHYVGK
ncbi:ACP S-malonyltransferase [Vagococcus humatus]|uniref:Malonyl CoA-acyl carrier protein transacylase n=1 Tax=Vagococcus humatus TaxID=1889241 RepID=A0A3R9ZXI9_9ENTE|nr:ACP S-malonyltransferase [Vagococcus humatus]RST90037.1 [acyl-carrier-protein] S-malonyltransferase [Vagococcus humatus]